MVRRGPKSKLKEVERAIVDMLLSSRARVEGLGFREIFRNLQNRPEAFRAGSYSTLGKCLRNLDANQVIRQDPVTKKYYFNEIGFAHHDRNLIIDAISKANVLGGGRLFQPDIETTENGIRIPATTPEIFAAADVFAQANLKEKWGWKDEGILFIETLEDTFPRKRQEPHKELKKAPRPQKEPMHFVNLTVQYLSARKTARNWVKTIWEYAKEHKLLNKDATLENASNEDLERIWKEIFEKAHVKTIVQTEFIDPQKLLEWLKTSRKSASSLMKTSGTED